MRYRPEWLSEGAEVLVARLGENPPPVFDVVVVGSGYGGAVAAARFAGADDGDGNPLKVCVLERGNEYVVGAFPNRLSELPGYVRYSRYDKCEPKGRRDGLFDFRFGADVNVLLASGLGGGSLINAAVAERASAALRHPAWPDAIRADPKQLEDWYDLAETMLGLKRGDANAFTKYAKYQEFKKFIQNYREFEKFTFGRPAADTRVEAAQPARLAIWSAHAGRNDQGVHQEPCIGCGDCVTGCNFNAKNTLAMNYLPEARRRGAEIYTGVTVLYLEQTAGDDGARWSVTFRLTREKGPAKVANPHRVRARHVVLAAGTLGSPEILMRSRARGLKLSAQLGKRFSGNGDMISALYDQRDKVNASATEHTPFAERRVGPTITGIAVAQTVSGERLTLEELAIPAALRRLFEEVVTTAALPVKLTKSDCSTHMPQEPDPAAVDENAIEHTQIFAAFGDDGARGALEMVNGWESWDWDGAITVAWPSAGKARVYELQDRLLGIDWGSGGLYLRSPLWRPLPEALSAALSGPTPEGKLLTVHPLGGCPMGNDCETGVVDDIGRVFDLEGKTSTYDGLLVLDGSIIPAALGTNPLLTIAALAERAVERYAATQGWKPALDRVHAGLPEGPPKLEPTQPPKAETRIRFAERMQGRVSLPGTLSRKVKCALETEFEPIDPAALLPGRDHAVPIHRAALSVAGISVPVTGEVRWLELGRTTALGRGKRAICTWLRTRALADVFQRARQEGLGAVLKMLFRSGSILKLATNVGEVRYLRYHLTVAKELRVGGEVLLPAGTRLTGLKTFQYSFGGNPWRQLSEMAVEARLPGGRSWKLGTMEIDALHMLRRYAVQLQIDRLTDVPTALLDLASIGLYLARVVMKIHFWSFRLPEYEKYDPDRAQRRLPGKLQGLEKRDFHIAVRDCGRESALVLPLTNYRPEGVAREELKGPVVLFHGFGSSGAQFAFPPGRPPQNLVTHLTGKGFDVWVPELRTSIGVPASHNQWTLDEVAINDIPRIVEAVLNETGARELDVVAHCIGSAMFCTAALAGELARGPADERGRAPSKVRSAVLLQVGPLVTLSEANQFNARLITFLKRYAEVDHVDSSIEEGRGDWVDALVDRLLNTYPYPAKEAEHHRLWPPWVPHTHIANCNRSAGVFGRLFDHANVDQSMLDSLGNLLGHTNLTTFEQTLQYAFLRRLTDYNATNAYVTRENIRRHFHFPVRFLHGLRNAVFLPETTTRSCRLLNEVNGAGSAERVLLVNYGHLDPLIGRCAHRDVFPKISRFLLCPVPRKRDALARPRATRFGRRPLIGPVLGWTRWDEQDGRWLARVWCRADDTRVDPSFVMTMPYRGGQPDLDSWEEHDLSELAPRPGVRATAPPHGFQASRPGDIARVYGIETLVAVDVPVAASAAGEDVEILVASAYEGLTSDPPPLEPETTASDDDRKRGYAKATDAERARWQQLVAQGQCATRTVDDGYDERMDSVLVRGAVLEALDRRRTRLSFAVASCRYAASVVDREVADFMFGKLRKLIGNAASDSPALLLLIGDQIYADATAGTFDPKTGRERFYESYHEAWTSPNARAVLRQLPTYMMLDDHEVADNWSKGQTDKETEEWGARAFLGYQWLHSPRDGPDLVGAPRGQGERYFYTFDAAGFPFFVCDTRITRVRGERIMHDEQLGALTDWLRNNKQPEQRHKFIASPSVVVPFRSETQRRKGPYRDAYLGRSDGWDAFPASLRRLMLCIVTDEIRNVVFLCGDAHRSMVSRIWFVNRSREERRLGTACIVSSALYAPFPFANSRPEEFAERGELQLDEEWTMHYAPEGKSLDPDSFAVVHADASAAQPSLRVAYHLRDGQEPDRILPGVAAP